MQTAWLKDTKHKEEVTEIAEQFHIDKGAEAIMKKKKWIELLVFNKNYHQHCRIRINVLVR